MLAMLLAVAVAAGPTETPAVDGFQAVKWGATPDQVRAAFPDLKQSGAQPEDFVASATVLGKTRPATFRFVGGKLADVTVKLADESLKRPPDAQAVFGAYVDAASALQSKYKLATRERYSPATQKAIDDGDMKAQLALIAERRFEVMAIWVGGPGSVTLGVFSNKVEVTYSSAALAEALSKSRAKPPAKDTSGL